MDSFLESYLTTNPLPCPVVLKNLQVPRDWTDERAVMRWTLGGAAYGNVRHSLPAEANMSSRSRGGQGLCAQFRGQARLEHARSLADTRGTRHTRHTRRRHTRRDVIPGDVIPRVSSGYDVSLSGAHKRGFDLFVEPLRCRVFHFVRCTIAPPMRCLRHMHTPRPWFRGVCAR